MNGNLYKSLLEAQKSLTGICKDANNDFANYKYVSAEEMVKTAREVLLNNGIVVGRKSWFYAPEPDGTYKVTSFLFATHPESNERVDFTIELPAVTRKGTPQDKAVACALTSSLSYFLRDLLMLPRFDPAENMDTHDDQHADSLNELIQKATILYIPEPA